MPFSDTRLTENDKKTLRKNRSNRGLFVVISGPQFGETFIVDKSQMIAGRSKGCSIIIDDAEVSKQHCIVYNDENAFFIEDMESVNKTYINKKHVKKRSRIHSGDRLILGNTVLKFLKEEIVE
ncbi:MAG: FHA domain-containing protein [Spirochaetia bacterium]